MFKTLFATSTKHTWYTFFFLSIRIHTKIIETFLSYTGTLLCTVSLFLTFVYTRVSFLYSLIRVALSNFVSHQLRDLASGKCLDVKRLLQKFVRKADANVSQVKEGILVGHDIL